MRTGYEVEQVFLRPKRGQTEVELVLVAPSGALKHERQTFPTREFAEAVRRSAQHLANRGDVVSASGLRLRVSREGSLKDDKRLAEAFELEFEDALERS